MLLVAKHDAFKTCGKQLFKIVSAGSQLTKICADGLTLDGDLGPLPKRCPSQGRIKVVGVATTTYWRTAATVEEQRELPLAQTRGFAFAISFSVAMDEPMESKAANILQKHLQFLGSIWIFRLNNTFASIAQ
jgi:hypothetical protein